MKFVSRLLSIALLAGAVQAAFAQGKANTPPQLTLIYPLGSNAQGGAFVTFKATATDAQDGNLSAAITWTSNLRGLLGSGSQLQVYMNALGSETFTAKVVDSAGAQDTEVRTLLVQSQVTTTASIWQDPSGVGGFLAFNQLATGDWIATWMAYEFDYWALLNYHPVWLQSGVETLAAGALSSDLSRITWDPSTQTGTPTVIGDVVVQVETNSQVRLTVTNTNAQNIDVVMTPWASASTDGAYWGYLGGTLDPGWVLFRGHTVFGPAGTEARIVTTFDGTQPRWAMGWGVPVCGSSAAPVPLYFWWPGTPSSTSTLPSYASSGSMSYCYSSSPAPGGFYGDLYLEFSPGNNGDRLGRKMVPVTVR